MEAGSLPSQPNRQHQRTLRCRHVITPLGGRAVVLPFAARLQAAIASRPEETKDPYVSQDIDTDVSLAKNMAEAPISYFGQTRCIVDCLAEAMDCFLLVFIILI
jgi:hypothetical protein